MNQQDAISRRWLDPARVKVVIAENVPKIFDEEDFIGLSGAFSESTVFVTFNGLAVCMEVAHPAVQKMRRELSFDGELGSWFVYNSMFRIRPDYWGQDLAARSIWRQAVTAQSLGVDRLSTYGVGNYQTASRPDKAEQWSGYWVWPRLGFDGDIPAEIIGRLAPAFRHYKKLSELMWTVEGRLEWLHQGDDVGVSFDVTTGSISWQNLERYTEERGIRV